MNIGIDITFFEPDAPDKLSTGRLYIDENGGDYIEFEGTLPDAFRTFKIIYAKPIKWEEKYTLMNCVFKQSKGGMYRFLINELYKGDFINKALECDCIEAEARMTGLTNWINNPRIKPEITFSTSKESRIIIMDFFTKTFPVSNNITLELTEFCGDSYDRNETILKNLSQIKFTCKNPSSRLELYKNVVSFLQLLSLFTFDLPQLTMLNFSFSNGRTVEHLSTNKVKITDENDALLSYDQIEKEWPKAIAIFYAQRDKFSKILALLIASIENITAEISFLNITTAFEVFHKYFLEDGNSSMRQTLTTELIEAEVINRDSGKWDQIIRYHHLFKFTEDIEFFKQNFQNPYKTIVLIRDSRNYYTHYTPSEKQIWTPNQLLFANKALRQLLKAVILKKLEIPDSLINKLLNNRGAIFYQDYEKNKYSLHYLDRDRQDNEQ